jgi:hypothetical protein
MTKLVYEVIEMVQNAKTETEKVEALRKHGTVAVKDVLRGTYDDRIQWLLPDTTPPYTPSQIQSIPSNLLRKNVQFKYFVKGGPAVDMVQFKREKLFIGLLESIHPKDAELVVQMIKKKPIKGINVKVINLAFPGLVKV